MNEVFMKRPVSTVYNLHTNILNLDSTIKNNYEFTFRLHSLRYGISSRNDLQFDFRIKLLQVTDRLISKNVNQLIFAYQTQSSKQT